MPNGRSVKASRRADATPSVMAAGVTLFGECLAILYAPAVGHWGPLIVVTDDEPHAIHRYTTPSSTEYHACDCRSVN